MTAKALDNLPIFNLVKKGTILESIPLKFLQRYDYFGNLPKKTESIYTFCCWVLTIGIRLPEIFLDVTAEGGFLRPTVVFEGLANVALHIGCHRTGAIVIFVVALTGIDMNEVVLDSALHPPWHIVIDRGEANRHTDGLVLAEQRTTFTLHLWIIQVDTVGI